MDDQRLINTDWLKSQYKGSIKELLEIYKKENDECLERINLALKEEGFDEIRSIAHKMKGSSRIIGAFTIENLSIRIESSSDPDTLKQLVTELATTYSNLKVEIASLLNQ